MEVAAWPKAAADAKAEEAKVEGVEAEEARTEEVKEEAHAEVGATSFGADEGTLTSGLVPKTKQSVWDPSIDSLAIMDGEELKFNPLKLEQQRNAEQPMLEDMLVISGDEALKQNATPGEDKLTSNPGGLDLDDMPLRVDLELALTQLKAAKGTIGKKQYTKMDQRVAAIASEQREAQEGKACTFYVLNADKVRRALSLSPWFRLLSRECRVAVVAVVVVVVVLCHAVRPFPAHISQRAGTQLGGHAHALAAGDSHRRDDAHVAQSHEAHVERHVEAGICRERSCCVAPVGRHPRLPPADPPASSRTSRPLCLTPQSCLLYTSPSPRDS